MKVSIIGHSYLAEENRKSLTALAKRVSLEVVSPRNSEGMIFSFDEDAPYIIGEGWVMKLYRKWHPPFLPHSAFLLRSGDLGFKALKPDIIHIEYDPFTPLFLQTFFTARRFAPRAAIVCMIRQNTFTQRNVLIDGLKTAVARMLVPRVDRFIAVNSGVAAIYRERFGASPKQITHCTQIGIDTALFSPGTIAGSSLERGDGLIGYCGRFVAYKGVLDLIQAVKLLRDTTGKDFRLILLGKGPMREELLTIAREHRWLTIMDSVPHAAVSAFLAALDIFVMPSHVLEFHEEHDAHALLEAMASGIPCVGAASGAIVDVLSGAGLIVPPQDKEALAGAIRHLADNPALRQEYGYLGRERVLNSYSIEAVADTYFRIYQDIILK